MPRQPRRERSAAGNWPGDEDCCPACTSAVPCGNRHVYVLELDLPGGVEYVVGSTSTAVTVRVAKYFRRRATGQAWLGGPIARVVARAGRRRTRLATNLFALLNPAVEGRPQSRRPLERQEAALAASLRARGWRVHCNK